MRAWAPARGSRPDSIRAPAARGRPRCAPRGRPAPRSAPAGGTSARRTADPPHPRPRWPPRRSHRPAGRHPDGRIGRPSRHRRPAGWRTARHRPGPHANADRRMLRGPAGSAASGGPRHRRPPRPPLPRCTRSPPAPQWSRPHATDAASESAGYRHGSLQGSWMLRSAVRRHRRRLCSGLLPSLPPIGVLTSLINDTIIY